MEDEANLNMEILKHLECVICYGYMLPPIYLCQRGHSLCNLCLKRLVHCPQCRAGLMMRSRNLALEAIVATLYFPCKYNEYGCADMYKTDAIESHQLMCCFRRYRCILDECEWEGRKNELYCHVLKHHEGFVHYEKVDNVKVDYDTDREKFMLCVLGNYFIVQKLIESKSDGSIVVRWLVQYVGKPENASNFIYKVKIYGDDRECRDAVLKDYCLRDSTTVDDIVGKSESCVTVPAAFLDEFKDSLGNIYYDVSVYNKEENL